MFLIQQNAGTVKWSDVRQLGRYCPHLETLKLRNIAVEDEVEVSAPSAQYPEDDSNEVAVLPRLRVCVIERQEELAYTFIRLFLRGMPSIEELVIGSGASTGDGLKPYIQDAFATPVASLRKLCIEGFRMSHASFSGINPGRIESIILKNCCHHANSALEAFRTSSNIVNAFVIEDEDAVRFIVKRG